MRECYCGLYVKTAEKSFKRSHFTELGNLLNADDR